jgi:hypothetical protein
VHFGAGSFEKVKKPLERNERSLHSNLIFTTLLQGAVTSSIITLSMTAISVITLRITAIRVITLRITAIRVITLSITAISVITLSITAISVITQHNCN